MTTILITGIGGDIAQGVASIIREVRPRARLIGTDVHMEHAGQLFVDRCVLLPLASDEGYFAALAATATECGADVVIPMTEPELSVISRGGQLAFRCVTAGNSVIAAGVDKLATATALEALDLPAPWTVSTDEAMPRQYPCILKPRFGSGSRGIMSVAGETDARFLARRFPNAVFQQLLDPHRGEITCAVYRRRDQQVSTLQLLRRLAGGLTGWAKVVHEPAVETLCARLAEGLQLTGSMNVQLRLTPAGPRVFEINPRFSSTALMRHRLGFKDVEWTLDELEGLPVTFPAVREGRIAVRLHGAAVLE